MNTIQDCGCRDDAPVCAEGRRLWMELVETENRGKATGKYHRYYGAIRDWSEHGVVRDQRTPLPTEDEK